MMIQLPMLRHFLTVAELGSFTLASDRLALSQSVISRSIKRLEELVGTLLLERTTRNVKLTPAGQAFLEDAHMILGRLKTASERARHIGHGDAIRLKIGVDLSVNLNPLVQALPAFRRNWPMIDLGLAVSQEPLADELKNGAVDLALMRLDQIPDQGLDWQVIARDPLTVAVPPDWYAGRRSIHLAELAERPWIMPDPALWPGIYDRFMRLCLSAGFEPRIAALIRDRDTALLLVACGAGALFRPRNPGLAFGWGGQLLEIEGLAENYINGTAVAWLRSTSPPHIAPFVDCILDFADDGAGLADTASVATGSIDWGEEDRKNGAQSVAFETSRAPGEEVAAP